MKIKAEPKEPRELEKKIDKIQGTPDDTMTPTMTPVRTSISKREFAPKLDKVEHPVKRAKVEPDQGLKDVYGEGMGEVLAVGFSFFQDFRGF